MKKTKMTRTLMAACSVVALSAVMYGCVHSGDDAPAPVVVPDPTAAVDLSGVTPDYMVAAGTYEIAAGEAIDVGDVTFSCAAGGADCMVTVAADGMATYATDGGMVTAANSAAYQTRLTMDDQLAAANMAVAAAEALVEALDAMSTVAEVAAADAAIAAAKAAVEAGTVLTNADKTALRGQIAVAELNLQATEMQITAYTNLAAANAAIKAAKDAVAGLGVGSTDGDADTAAGLIEAARTAVSVAEATLTDDEVAMLNTEIADAAAALVIARMDIARQEFARLHEEVRGATDDAIAAGAAAAGALEDAAKYAGMLGATFVGGDSAMATANAEKVLAARDAAILAVKNAVAAKTRAETALAEARALPEGTEEKDALIGEAIIASSTATTQLTSATVIRDGTDLAAHVAKVIGDDPIDDETAVANIGDGVATLIADALALDGDGSGATRFDHDATVPVPSRTKATDLGSVPVRLGGSGGMTWAEIVAEQGRSLAPDQKLLVTPIGVRPAGDFGAPVDVLPLDGTLTSAIGDDGTGFTTLADVESQLAYFGSTQGISGWVLCAGADCTTTGRGDTQEFAGSWYFAVDPGTEDTTYVDAAGGGYEAEPAFASYGHWVDVDSATGLARVWAFGRVPTGATTVDLDFTNPDHLPGTATYTGDASGMSVHHKEIDSDGNPGSTASGPFTADVSLTMEFGGVIDSALWGMVSGFKGSAVDTSWEVTLEKKLITNTDGILGAPGFTDGVTNDDPGDGTIGEGVWTAQAYGETGERPTGVVGTFDAHFPDGDVGGGYATLKQ